MYIFVVIQKLHDSCSIALSLMCVFISFMQIAIGLLFVYLYAHISFHDDLRYAAVPFAA